MDFLTCYLLIGLVCIALAVAVEPDMRNAQNARGVMFVSLVLLFAWPIPAAWVLGNLLGQWMRGE
jgi:hypothetical protein